MQTTNTRRVEGCLDSERNVLLVLVKNGKLCLTQYPYFYIWYSHFTCTKENIVKCEKNTKSKNNNKQTNHNWRAHLTKVFFFLIKMEAFFIEDSS